MYRGRGVRSRGCGRPHRPGTRQRPSGPGRTDLRREPVRAIAIGYRDAHGFLFVSRRQRTPMEPRAHGDPEPAFGAVFRTGDYSHTVGSADDFSVAPPIEAHYRDHRRSGSIRQAPRRRGVRSHHGDHLPVLATTPCPHPRHRWWPWPLRAGTTGCRLRRRVGGRLRGSRCSSEDCGREIRHGRRRPEAQIRRRHSGHGAASRTPVPPHRSERSSTGVGRSGTRCAAQRSCDRRCHFALCLVARRATPRSASRFGLRGDRRRGSAYGSTSQPITT